MIAAAYSSSVRGLRLTSRDLSARDGYQTMSKLVTIHFRHVVDRFPNRPRDPAHSAEPSSGIDDRNKCLSHEWDFPFSAFRRRFRGWTGL